MNFKKYNKIVEIAKECHTQNSSLSFDVNSVPWEELDRHTKYINIKSVKRIVDDPKITAKDIHDEWMKNKIADGWKYGEIRDVELKTHPLITDYHNLGEVDKIKDQVFIDIVNKYIELGELSDE